MSYPNVRVPLAAVVRMKWMGSGVSSGDKRMSRNWTDTCHRPLILTADVDVHYPMWFQVHLGLNSAGRNLSGGRMQQMGPGGSLW